MTTSEEREAICSLRKLPKLVGIKAITIDKLSSVDRVAPDQSEEAELRVLPTGSATTQFSSSALGTCFPRLQHHHRTYLQPDKARAIAAYILMGIKCNTTLAKRVILVSAGVESQLSLVDLLELLSKQQEDAMTYVR